MVCMCYMRSRARVAMQLASVLVSNVLRLSSTLTTGVSHTRTCSSSGEQETQRNGTLYVHWPYCAQLCTYCNFNKYHSRSALDHDHLFSCLVREFRSMLDRSTISTFTSVYFGGGTPSLAGAGLVEAVLNVVSSSAHLDREAEVCLEANPTSANLSQLRGFKAAGVNRLSLGIQSLRDADLQLLNRDHTSEEGLWALRNARSVFPGRVNMDVIFGRPEQTLVEWRSELRELLEVVDCHASLYQLTVERGTPLATAVTRGELTLPDDDTMADLYEHAVKSLEQDGLRRYEVSNFARVGHESRHNLSYWTGSDYIGIGPGAHSRYLSREGGGFTHTVTTLEPKAWSSAVQARGDGVVLEKRLTREQRLEEVIATSLRTRDGLSREIWSVFSDQPFPTEGGSVRLLTQAGLLEIDSRGLRATSRGVNVLDSVLPELMQGLQL